MPIKPPDPFVRTTLPLGDPERQKLQDEHKELYDRYDKLGDEETKIKNDRGKTKGVKRREQLDAKLQKVRDKKYEIRPRLDELAGILRKASLEDWVLQGDEPTRLAALLSLGYLTDAQDNNLYNRLCALAEEEIRKLKTELPEERIPRAAITAVSMFTGYGVGNQIFAEQCARCARGELVDHWRHEGNAKVRALAGPEDPANLGVHAVHRFYDKIQGCYDKDEVAKVVAEAEKIVADERKRLAEIDERVLSWVTPEGLTDAEMQEAANRSYEPATRSNYIPPTFEEVKAAIGRLCRAGKVKLDKKTTPTRLRKVAIA
jgi:hypothetical protein